MHIIHKIHVDYVDNFLQLLSTSRLWIKKRSFPQAIHIYRYMKKTCQKAGIIDEKPAQCYTIHKADGRFPLAGEVMSMTTYEKLALVLALLQLLLAFLALLK